MANVLYLILDLYFEEFFSYLSTSAVFNLIFVSRFLRRKLMPKLKIYFELAEGFGSQKRWRKFILQTNLNLARRLFYTDVISKWPFDHIFRKVLQDFRKQIFYHLNLPSILYHFLTCARTCDTVSPSNFCRQCSRIGYARDPLWQPFIDSFDNITITKDNCKFFFDDMFVDLDVFTSKANEYFQFKITNFKLKFEKCFYYQSVQYCHELLAIFCSHLVRMFLSVLSFLVTNLFVTESDKQELLEVFVKEAINFFCEFIHQFNTEYFYELFDQLKELNKSFCFNLQKNKKYGPYIHSAFDITLYTINI